MTNWTEKKKINDPLFVTILLSTALLFVSIRECSITEKKYNDLLKKEGINQSADFNELIGALRAGEVCPTKLLKLKACSCMLSR